MRPQPHWKMITPRDTENETVISHGKETQMPDQLRQLQLVETDMLATFDRICRRHDIPYFIAFGTAIGAVRHQGFIPWDDDIDLAMLRKDFDRLREVPQDEWEGLELVTAGNTPYYHERIFPRVYKPGTVFETQAWHDTLQAAAYLFRVP